MRKSILMFIAATIASAAGSFPAAACEPSRMQCLQGCADAYVPWDPNWKEVCRAKCESIHRKCSIKQEVTIPGPSWARPGKLPVINRPPNGGSGIPAGGILDSVTGMGGQGPSATGTPLGGGRAPSAPPVIIR